MSILKKICGKLLQLLLPEKIPDFAATMYVNLVKNAKTDFYRTVAKEIAEKIEARRDIFNLMDIGTGPGFMLFEIAKLNPYLEMVGIDLSRKLIDFAKREAGKRSYGNIFFEIGDANHLDFEDNVCDFVISSGVLHSLKNPIAAIKEWLRVLKPGHDLWIYDPTVLAVRKEMPWKNVPARWSSCPMKSVGGWFPKTERPEASGIWPVLSTSRSPPSNVG